MVDTQEELLRLTYTRIGMIMEDASSIALELGGPKSVFDSAKVDELRKSVDAISALMDAAEALNK